jgi:hypothetical protein
MAAVVAAEMIQEKRETTSQNQSRIQSQNQILNLNLILSLNQFLNPIPYHFR